MVCERPVVLFSRSSCCMCHTIKSLFVDFGVNPTVYELDEISRGREVEQALLRLGCNPAVPAVFIGGELVGGANEIMSLHLRRALQPMLKRAGALWRVTKMVSEKPVVLFTRSSCCMCHSIKLLFIDCGVNPTVYELDNIPQGREVEQELLRLGCNSAGPAVFIGGELVGGANETLVFTSGGQYNQCSKGQELCVPVIERIESESPLDAKAKSSDKVVKA
ncbi:hypothetical protein RJ640_014884 [Escallonia rubra]|uniref:Glutaredoxin domain-containing protein n=1 Tax=Escallonia rubra TaxID=112253 RepID=A0AA88USX5_9ASTE|nr:hypothetical protein RJ640_014884 [Escallonia rubra]